MTYNQIMDLLVDSKSHVDQKQAFPLSDEQHSAVEQWMKETASQMTKFGMADIYHNVHNLELCVLFRNNHFLTLHKRGTGLYTLVTDEGIHQNEPRILWQKMNHLDGEEAFVDANFGKPGSSSTSTMSSDLIQYPHQRQSLSLAKQAQQLQQSPQVPQPALTSHAARQEQSSHMTRPNNDP